MRAYIYCSYKNSPEGYQLGAITYNADAVDDYIPTNEALEPLVVKAFDSGIVEKVCGLLPNTSKYIYLVKQLKKNNVVDEAEGDIDIYMNLAFEFDHYDEYRNFVGNFDRLSTEEVTDACAKFIKPDRSIDIYALKVKAVEFNAFIKKMSMPSKLVADAKKIFIEAASSEPQTEKLQSIFGCEFSFDGGRYVYPPKKKNPPNIGGSSSDSGNPLSDFLSGIKKHFNR